MAQYSFSTEDKQLISDIKDIQQRKPGHSFSRIIEVLLQQAVKEVKRLREKNAKKVHTECNTANIHQDNS